MAPDKIPKRLLVNPQKPLPAGTSSAEPRATTFQDGRGLWRMAHRPLFPKWSFHIHPGPPVALSEIPIGGG